MLLIETHLRTCMEIHGFQLTIFKYNARIAGVTKNFYPG